VEKYGRVRQATVDNIIRRMRFMCWITKATDTHLQYVILIAFPRQHWLRKHLSAMFICTPPVLFLTILSEIVHMHLTLILVCDGIVLYCHWSSVGVFCPEGLILPYL
jgi:hypothetical protein